MLLTCNYSVPVDFEREVKCLRKWLREMESRLQPLSFHINWTLPELEEKAVEHMVSKVFPIFRSHANKITRRMLRRVFQCLRKFVVYDIFYRRYFLFSLSEVFVISAFRFYIRCTFFHVLCIYHFIYFCSKICTEDEVYGVHIAPLNNVFTRI